MHQHVDWILARAAAHLAIPRRTACELRSDAAFCRNGEVRAIIRRRCRHLDCRPGPGGCTVVEGADCGGPRRWSAPTTGPGVMVAVLELATVLAAVMVLVMARLVQGRVQGRGTDVGDRWREVAVAVAVAGLTAWYTARRLR